MARRRVTGVLVLVLTCTAVGAADRARERRLVDEMVAGLFTGDVIELTTAEGKFLAIDTRPEVQARGRAVIILHGRGLHADWPQVVSPLRTQLAERGWRTLSLQMPVLDKTATYYDYVTIFGEAFPRIEAGIQYLRNQGVDELVLLAHSCGVHMAMAWLRERGDNSIDAFVGIGMGAIDYQQPMKQPFPLDRLRVPVLDVYGADDYPAVRRNAPRRAAAMRSAGNPHSRQILVSGANHFFHGQQAALLDVIEHWLSQLDHSR